MKKFVLSLFLLGSIVLGVSGAIDYVFTSVFQKGKTYKSQWLHSIENSAYDVGVIGNSRAWWNINMNEFNDKLGLRCINLSNNHFSNNEILLRLKEFYANGNSIDVLLIQTEYWEFFRQEEGFSKTVYNNIPFLNDSLTYTFLSERSDEWKKLKYIPLWRYSEYNRQWGVEEFLITILGKRNSVYDSTGTFFSNNRFYGDPTIELKKADSFSINPNFMAVYEFCLSQDIQVGFFTAPIYHAIIHQASQDQMEKQLNSIGAPYRNYLDIYSDSTFFNNNTHLSIKGGKPFTDTLINFTRSLLAEPNLQ